VKNDIALKIRTLRKGRRITQQELADNIGLNRCTIGNYETGRRTPHLSELTLIADFFGVGLDYFGVASKDEVFEVLSRAKEVFESETIPKDEKEDLYRELMKLYLAME
jgi:transcriptional regulator with XRE-family HTH domain